MIDLSFVEETWGLKSPNLITKYEVKGNRSVRLIESSTEKFILKGFPEDLTEAQISRYTAALTFLSSKGKKISPRIIRTKEAKLYVEFNGKKYYLLEYIAGRQAQENPSDEFIIGQASAYMHTMVDYWVESDLNVVERIAAMKGRFSDYAFKDEYDHIIRGLPEFNQLSQAFIHTDIGSHNSIITPDGNVIFIDFDGAGRGSIYIDVGYPLITQFVRFDVKGKLFFNYENAKSFYDGYFSIRQMTETEKELIYYGAVFMQLMYMPCFGDKAVNAMWSILKYAVDNKAELMRAVR